MSSTTAPAQAQGGERRFTDEQRAAIRRRTEPLLLAAGAGSGKTAVLVERFVQAVLEDGVSPAAILAITFTDRAAGELRERVRARFLALGRRDEARDTESAFVSTFHGFCARVLRAHALIAGVDPGFAVLDEGLAAGLRARAFERALAGFMAEGGASAVDLVAAYTPDDARDMTLSAFAALRSRGERFPRLPRPAAAGPGDDTGAAAVAACALLDDLLDRFAHAYEDLKHGRGALDFDDLELIAKELLETEPRVRDAWAGRFALLMVDEFQDTNPRQLAIVSALDRDNLFTVGDELQAIYGFRHADVGLFRARRALLRERDAELLLTGNFRTHAAVLDVINAVFASRLGEAFTPLVARRDELDGAETGAHGAEGGSGADAQPGSVAGPGAAAGTRAAAPSRAGQAPAQQSLFDLIEDGAPQASAPAHGEPRVELLLTAREGWDQPAEAEALEAGMPAAPGWRRAEARALAARVGELVAAGDARAGEIVVLLRATGDIEVYERALQLQGLRTLAYVGGFWGRLETRDLLAYLRTLANPLDETALYCTLASPLAGLSSDGLALLARAGRAARGGAWQAALAVAQTEAHEGGAEEPLAVAQARAHLAAADRAALQRFCALLSSERRTAAGRPISQLLGHALDASGYREHLLAGDWAERRLANVHKLLRVARRYEASEGGELRGFLDHVERLQDARVPEADAPVEGIDQDTVRLMTIHAAKGLEFPVVCVADLGRAPNNRQPRLLVDGERIGLMLLRLDGQRAVPALDYDELCAARQLAEAREEDRILYVAMTRARERLLLSGGFELDRLAERREGPPINWLAPAIAGSVQAPGVLDPPVIDVTIAPCPDDGLPSLGEARVRCRFNLAGHESEERPPAPPPWPLAAGAAAPRGRAAGPFGGAADLGSHEPGRHGDGDGTRAHAAGDVAPADVARLSYTSLGELERCGYRYYVERVLGLAELEPHAAGADTGLEARARGTLVHAVLEECGPQAAPAQLDQALQRLSAALGVAAGTQERAELAALLAGAARAPLAARVAAAGDVRREHPFAYALAPEGSLVTGVLDVLAREPDDAALVVDYKSDRIGDGDPAALVERDYGLQRLVYALAVLRDASVASVEVVHWYLERPLEPVTVRFEGGERVALEAQLAERVRSARERGYAVTETPHRALCETCPGRARLCSWDEERTLADTV